MALSLGRDTLCCGPQDYFSNKPEKERRIMATPSKTATARKPNAAFMKPLTPAPSWPLSSARKPCRVPRSPRRSGITSKAQPAGCQQQAQHQRRRQAAPHLRQRPGHDVRTDQAGQRAPEVIDRAKGRTAYVPSRLSAGPAATAGIRLAQSASSNLRTRWPTSGPHCLAAVPLPPPREHPQHRQTAPAAPRCTLLHPASAASCTHQPPANENGWHEASRCERNRGLHPIQV